MNEATIAESRVDGYVGQALIRARLEVVTGLHIGAGNDEIEIGGIDNPVIKTPSGDPYVPGSSIKGKLRFLLEWAFGTIDEEKHGAWQGEKGDDGVELRPENVVPRVFGSSADTKTWLAGPTRLLVRDAMPREEWRQSVLDAGRELTEVKTEVTIDRIAGKALDGGLRAMERVPPGALFDFEAAFRVYSVGGDGGAGDLRCLAWVLQGLDLLEQDALGGSVSRGYGQIRFKDVRLEVADRKEHLDNLIRGRAFSREEPPRPILEAVHRVFGR